MRFFASFFLLVSSVVILICGIGQQTWWKPAPTVTLTVPVSSDTSAVLLDNAALTAHSGETTVRVTADSDIVAGAAIQSDVEAWLGDGQAEIVTVAGDEEGDTPELSVTSQGTEDVPSAAGADLWITEFDGSEYLVFSLEAQNSEAVILSGGEDSTIRSVRLQWAQDTSAPLALPLLIIGGLTLIAGGAMLAVAIRHERKAVAPRRVSRRAAGKNRAAQPRTRRRGRRAAAMGAAAVSGVIALVLTGCSAGEAALSSSATASAVVENTTVSENSPRLTSEQAIRILSDISAVDAEASSSLDASVAEQRFSGAALTLRTQNYAARAQDDSVAAVTLVPDLAPSVFLPQLSSEWPRQAFVVVGGESEDDTSQALMLVQESPRENYTVAAQVELVGQLPALPAASTGGVSLAADTSLLTISPSEVGDAYSDVIANGDQSEFAELFASTSDSFIDAVHAREDKITSDLGSSASVSFARSQDAQVTPLSMATADSGAIVAVFVTDVETMTPADGYELEVSGETAALLGKSTTEKSVVATYGDVFLFSVPGAGSTQKVSLLGFSSGIISAEEK